MNEIFGSKFFLNDALKMVHWRIRVICRIDQRLDWKMPARNKPGTVQFRTALLRKLKNMEPDYKVEFFDAVGRTVFRMIDKLGRPRSNKISISALAPDSLQKQYLLSHLKWADFPKKHPDTDH